MKKVFAFVLVSALFLCSCNAKKKSGESSVDEDSLKVTEKAETENAMDKLENIITEDTSLVGVAQIAVKELSEKKIPSSACFNKPLRFSPYAFIEKNSRVLNDTISAVAFFKDKNKYNWGKYDGSGEPITLTNEEYFSKFVWDKDYSRPDEVVTNKPVGDGNTKNNVKDQFPNGYTVDFKMKGINNSMNWSTLRLVYEKNNGKYCLVGIVHDQWTI